MRNQKKLEGLSLTFYSTILRGALAQKRMIYPHWYLSFVILSDLSVQSIWFNSQTSRCTLHTLQPWMQSIYYLYCDAIWLTRVSGWFDNMESAICARWMVSKLKRWSDHMELVVKNNELCGISIFIFCLLNDLFNPFHVSVHTPAVYSMDVFRPLKQWVM